MTVLQVSYFPHARIPTNFRILVTPSAPASASQWKPLSSLLSPWKRAATEIELQFALRHLGEDLSRGDTRNAASVSLNQLTDQIFSHSFTRDEASFVATIVQCTGAEVAGKVTPFSRARLFRIVDPCQFLNDGIKHIVRILGLGAPALRETGSTNVITRAGDILRLLTLTLEPLRGSNKPPRIEGQIQDEILPRICNRLEEIKAVLLTEKKRELDKLSTTSRVTFLARLLHFVLTIGTAWSTRAKDVAQPLASVLTQLTLVVSPILLSLLDPLIRSPAALWTRSLAGFHNLLPPGGYPLLYHRRYGSPNRRLYQVDAQPIRIIFHRPTICQL